MRLHGFLLLALLVLSLNATRAEQTTGSVDELASWLAGSFSSQAQAQRDSTFFDVRLHVVPIWKRRTDARWLYVEQAIASHLERPYRQRVYRVTAEDEGGFESAVFTLPDPLRFAGAWREETPLARLSPDSLLQREGCSVFLHKREERYVGETRGKDCASTLRGAAHATSEVIVEKTRLTSLDRGYDAEGTQVWGSEAGPYEFLRLP